MLKLEYLFENYELAREALSLWEHDEDNLEEMLGVFPYILQCGLSFYQGGQGLFPAAGSCGGEGGNGCQGRVGIYPLSAEGRVSGIETGTLAVRRGYGSGRYRVWKVFRVCF